MVRPGRERLSGEVEVDEAFVGGVEEGGGRRHIGNKALVTIAVEVRGAGIGRIRMQRITDSSSTSLMSFVRGSITEGSVVTTDGLQSYRELPETGYRHNRRIVQGSGEDASKLLPRVHRVASLVCHVAPIRTPCRPTDPDPPRPIGFSAYSFTLLGSNFFLLFSLCFFPCFFHGSSFFFLTGGKRWLLGTHQGAVSREHLDYYLDEFTFRFNRRTSRPSGKLFYRLLEQAVSVDPTTFSDITKGIRGRKRKQPQSVGPT